MKRLVFVFALLLPTQLYAQSLEMPAYTPIQCAGSHLLDAVPLNAAAGSRTFTVGPKLPTCAGMSGKPLIGYNTAVFFLYFDYTANAGTITLTCTGGPTAADASYKLTTCTLSSGTCTLNWSGIAVTASLSADTKWEVVMGIKGNQAIQCVVSHGGTPGATDKITVDGFLYAD